LGSTAVNGQTFGTVPNRIGRGGQFFTYNFGYPYGYGLFPIQDGRFVNTLPANFATLYPNGFTGTGFTGGSATFFGNGTPGPILSTGGPGLLNPGGFSGNSGPIQQGGIRQVDFTGNTGANAVRSTSGYSPGAEYADRALVYVTTPPDASVWFDDHATQQRGMNRLFMSPPLDPTRSFSYTITASWRENGEQKTISKEVDVRAGEVAVAQFLRPDPTAPENDRIPARDVPQSPEPTEDPTSGRERNDTESKPQGNDAREPR
jgi:uncharacterized protein (TIGR03000 family)